MAPSKGRKQQHVDNQVQRLLAEGIPQARIYVDDGRSGTLRSRPGWDKLLAVLREGDVLKATKLDRIGRSLVNIVDVANLLHGRGVDLVMLDQPIDTTSPYGEFFFKLMALLAELEANITRERTLEGLAAAKERHGGKIPVRGPSITADQIETARMLARQGMPAARIADVVGVSRATLYRHVDVGALREGSPENGRSET
jgi:DNA invertase Pin-like site-specific DNA recombinase